MSQLCVYSEVGEMLSRTESGAEIAEVMSSVGVQFSRWQADRELTVDANQDEVLAAYAGRVQQLKDQYGFQSADVVSLTPDNPDCSTFRGKFLDEHVHADFEVRFFVDGRGLFYLHVEDKVYGLLCEKNDLISVPANTRHWFDMGAEPFFKCIRLFTTPEGWVAEFTGDNIAGRFPTFEGYLEVSA